jgi:hypothetical protein
MSAADCDDLGIECPGCGVPLRMDNAGGYRCFCQRCVDVMPPLPKEPGGYFIEGKYPDFRWVRAGE